MKKLFDKAMSARISFRTLIFIMIIASAMLLIPMIVIGFYDAPSSDDFGHCIETYHVWNSTGSIAETIKASFAWAKGCYNSIGGTFIAYFFDTLTPSIFGEKYYIITPFIIMIPFFASQFYFSFTVYKKILKIERTGVLILTLISLIISTQFLPSASQGFYWYVGAFTYTVFYSLMLFVSAIMLKYVYVKDEKRHIAGIIVASVLGFMVGGGNYVSALTMGIILAVTAVLSFLSYGKSLRGALPVIVLVSWGISFAINMTAPGNSGRSETFGLSSPGLIKSIIYSVKETILQIDAWSSLPVIALFVLLVPVLWHYSSKAEHKFRCPVLISLGSFCLLCAMFFPSVYGMNSIGEGRLQNIVFFTFVILTVFNIYYWTGWISHKISVDDRSDKKSVSAVFCAALAVAVLFGVFTTVTYPVTSISAAKSIISGEARQYKDEAENRFEILHSVEGEDVLIPGFKAQPYVIFTDKDICTSADDELYGRNEAMSDYYSQKTVMRYDD